MTGTVADLMSGIAVAIRPDCPAPVALSDLATAGADVLFVVDADGRWLGLVTGYELLKADLNGSLTESTIGQLMHVAPHALAPEQSLGEAAKLFREAAISTVPVVRDGRLLGMIDRKAVLRWLASQRAEPAAPPIAPPKFLQRTGGVTAMAVAD